MPSLIYRPRRPSLIITTAAIFLSTTAPFLGNTNRTITSITPSITPSRVTGTAPFFAQFSASAVTAGGTSRPFEDLDIKWNFADPTGTEFFNQPLSGSPLLNKYSPHPVNMNDAQTGPEAAYCWRTPGTYLVVMTVRGRSSGGFSPLTANTITQTATVLVTVNAPSVGNGYVTAYVDSVNGNSAWDGTSPTHTSGTVGPKQTMADINGLIAASGTNLRLRLAQGSSWTGTNGIDSNLWAGGTVSTSGLRIDNYVGASGAGANPIVTMNGTSGASQGNAFLLDNSGSHFHDDTVITGIDFANTTGATTGTIIAIGAFNSAQTINDLYFDNVNVTETLAATHSINVIVQWTGGAFLTSMNRGGVWGGSIVGTLTGAANGGSGFFGGARNWYFHYGFSISGASSDATRDHHIYPNVQTHYVCKYVNFGSSGAATRGYCINGNYDGNTDDPTPAIAQWWVISDNFINGTNSGLDVANGFPANDPSVVQINSVVVQRNACTNMQLSFGVLFFVACAITITVRDNIAWGLNGAAFYAPDTSGGSGANTNAKLAKPQLHRNKGYVVTGSGSQAFIETSSDATISAAWEVTDQIVYSTESAAILFNPVVASFVSATAFIDRNEWAAPNDTDAKFLGVPVVTFAAWQANFDTNGNTTTPTWNNPAVGDFS